VERGERAWHRQETEHLKAVAALKRALSVIVLTPSTRSNETFDA
jgi:hypothetical protein